jgi:hypothetical protein
MTIYDLVYEEEQQEIYNILLNPPKTVIDPLQSGILPENQISFMCRVKRGSIEEPTKVIYDYVEFTGYFRKFLKYFHFENSNSHYIFQVTTLTLKIWFHRVDFPDILATTMHEVFL